MTVWLIRPEAAEIEQRRAAAALAAHGLGRGDRVALAVPNSPEALAVVMGAARTGVVPVLLNATLLPLEIDALVADAEPALTIRSTSDLQRLVSFPDEAELAPVLLCRPMHYTSGTSGQPKGVWSGVWTLADATAAHDDEAAVWDLGPEDTHLTCSPLYHSVAVRFSSQALLRGAPLVLCSRFDAVEVSAAIGEMGVRSAFMVPTHMERLGPVDWSGLRLLAHAGAPCPRALKHRLLDALPAGSVWEFYGSTEGQFTVCAPDEWISHPGTVGRPRPGRRLSTDDDGQIWCTAPGYARFEYWRDPLKTAAAWRGNAFTVGDAGRLDADGYLYLDGRRDDLIISGGVNIYPAEVEQALHDVPGVEEIAVFGLPDEQWGQRVCAAVVGSAAREAVMGRARERLAGYKRPKDVYFLEELPKTGTGKLRRAAIAAMLGLEPPAP